MDRIDSQGPGDIAARLRMRASSPVSSAEPAKPAVANAGGSGATRLKGVGLAGLEAPIDEARVGAIRTAIQQGHYPIEPEKAADAMIAAGYMLRNEP